MDVESTQDTTAVPYNKKSNQTLDKLRNNNLVEQ